MPATEPISATAGGPSASQILAVLYRGCDTRTILKKSAQLAALTGSSLTAVFAVPDRLKDDPKIKKASSEALYQARQSGAKTVVLEGKDPAVMISEFASLYHTGQIVIGSSALKAPAGRFESSLLRRLQQLLPDHSFTVITESGDSPGLELSALSEKRSFLTDLLLSVLTMAAATAIGLLLLWSGLSEVSAIPVYSLAVLIVSLVCSSWKAGIGASVLSIVLYNFLFAEPRMSIRASNSQNFFVYLTMLVTSIFIGLLVNTMKRHILSARQNANKTRLLFDTNELLQMAGSPSEIIDILCQQSRILTMRNIVYYSWDGLDLSEPRVYPVMHRDPPSPRVLNADREMARLAADNSELTGAGSLNPGNAVFLYLPVKTSDRILGVLGVEMKDGGWEGLESDVLQAIILKSALTMENIRLAGEMEEARLQAKNEETRSNLLRMISHDLRTPLTSILGNISNLLLDKGDLSPETRSEVYSEIYGNTTWLIKLVENLLSASRMEDGSIQVHPSPDILEEAVNEAVKGSVPINADHRIDVQHEEDFILTDIDAGMIIRAVSNLLDNAQQYSPPGSLITVKTWIKDGNALVDVMDEGPGISQEVREHMFDMFYSGNKVSADSRKNLGLGLFLPRQIVEAHKGSVIQENLKPSGSLFRISIPLSDLSVLHE